MFIFRCVYLIDQRKDARVWWITDSVICCMTSSRIKNLTSKNLPKISEAFIIAINLTPLNAWLERVLLSPWNLRMSAESCLLFNWHSSRAASGISFFIRVPTKDDKYSINWRNNIVAVIACDTVMKAFKKTN